MPSSKNPRRSKRDRREKTATASSSPGVVDPSAAKHLVDHPHRDHVIKHINTKPVSDRSDDAAPSTPGVIVSHLKTASTPEFDTDAAPPSPVVSPPESPVLLYFRSPPDVSTLRISSPPFKFCTGDEYTPPMAIANSHSPRPLALLEEIRSPPLKFSDNVTVPVSERNYLSLLF